MPGCGQLSPEPWGSGGGNAYVVDAVPTVGPKGSMIRYTVWAVIFLFT